MKSAQSRSVKPEETKNWWKQNKYLIKYYDKSNVTLQEECYHTINNQ